MRPAAARVPSMTSPRFDAYGRFIERRRGAILIIAGLVTALGTVLAAGLPLRADLSNLLPPRERSVRDLEAIERRTSALGLVLVAISSADPARRSAAAHAMAARTRALGPDLVADVVADESLVRRYTWEHRFLFAPLADLEAAREALQGRLRRSTMKANPLYVPLGDPKDEANAA